MSYFGERMRLDRFRFPDRESVGAMVHRIIPGKNEASADSEVFNEKPHVHWRTEAGDRHPKPHLIGPVGLKGIVQTIAEIDSGNDLRKSEEQLRKCWTTGLSIFKDEGTLSDTGENLKSLKERQVTPRLREIMDNFGLTEMSGAAYEDQANPYPQFDADGNHVSVTYPVSAESVLVVGKDFGRNVAYRTNLFGEPVPVVVNESGAVDDKKTGLLQRYVGAYFSKQLKPGLEHASGTVTNQFLAEVAVQQGKGRIDSEIVEPQQQ